MTAAPPPTSVRRGFSLLEVVLAVGVFAFAIVAVVGLLGPTSRATAEVLDANIAGRLASAIEVELRRYGYTNVVAATNAGTILLTATPDGSRVLRESGANPPADNPPNSTTEPGIDYPQRYFQVEVARFEVGNDLAYRAADGYLALTVRVSWPYYRPNGPPPGNPPATVDANRATVTPGNQRNFLTLTLALPR